VQVKEQPEPMLAWATPKSTGQQELGPGSCRFFLPLSKDRNLEIDISLLSVLTKPSYYIVVGSYFPMCGGNPFSFIQPVYLT